MRISSLATAGLTVVSMFATLATRANADEALDRELKSLAGTWKFVSLRSDGDDAPAGVFEKWRMTFKGDEMIMSGGNQPNESSRSSYKIVPSASPKTIDLESLDEKSKGKKIIGIYKIVDGKLSICLGEGKREALKGRPRPTEFDGGADFTLIVLERAEEK